MAFAGRMAYAERRHDNENQEGEIHAPRDTANGNAAKVDQPDQLKDSEHKTFVEQTERLLACPCLDDLKQGPCGQRFQDAFRCFILSKEAEKGAECAYQFTQFEMCMDANHVEMFRKATEKKAPRLDPRIPRVPWQSLNFGAKFAEWAKKNGQ